MAASRPAQTPSPPWGTWPIVRPVGRARPWVVGVVFAMILLPLTIPPKVSGNVLSRYMTIESIVERGTLAIERSPLLARSGSPDVARFGNHAYSDKPPVLPALASPVYEVLYQLGYRFAGPGRSFVVANAVLTWVVVGLASGWAVVWVRRLAQCVPVAPWVADILTLALAFGSPLLTYGVTFNNHSVAAALIVASVGLTAVEGSRRDRFLAGAFASLASTIDLPAGALSLASLGVIHAIRCRNVPILYLLGSLGPILFHTWIQGRITGTPFPVEMYPAAFEYPGSYWLTPAGKWVEHGPRAWFGVEFLVGPQGWLTVTPSLWFGGLGVVMALFGRSGSLRPIAVASLLTTVVMVAFYTWGVRRTDFAGWSFGTRHLLALVPVGLVFAMVAVGRISGAGSRLGRWLGLALFAVSIAIGVVYAWKGQRDPWSRVEQRLPTDPTLRSLQRLVLYPWSSYTR